MARFTLRLAIGGVLLSITGLTDGLAQSPRVDDGSDTQIIVRRDGKITNVIVTDENTARLTRMFGELRALPPASDDLVVQWIGENQLKLPPYFLYELARRKFAKDRGDAVAWFLIAGLRARYDALRCVDPSAGQNVLTLPQLAHEVGAYATADRAETGRIIRFRRRRQHIPSPPCPLAGATIGSDGWTNAGSRRAPAAVARRDRPQPIPSKSGAATAA